MKISSGLIAGCSRSIAICNVDLLSINFSNCLGVFFRDKGQSLVPTPPAKIIVLINELIF